MKNLSIKLIWLWMIIAMSGCTVPSQPTAAPIPTKAPTLSLPSATAAPSKVAVISPTQTRTPAQRATSSPAFKSILKVWSIKSGDLVLVGAASDGNLYGFLGGTTPSYVAISNTGQVVKSTTPTKINPSCFRDTIKEWFVVRPNGTIVSTGFDGTKPACVFEPGDPPEVTILNAAGGFLPYSKDPKAAKKLDSKAYPSGFSTKGIMYADPYWDSRNRFYEWVATNKSTRQVGYINQNGDITLIKFPENVDFDQNVDKNGIGIQVMPWDDVYVTFNTWDALGNVTKNYFKAASDGAITPGAKLPEGVKGNQSSMISYLPDQKKIYFRMNVGPAINVYDTNYKLITSYQLSGELKSAGVDDLFVGNDQALYYFDKFTKTLSKYSLPE